MVQLTTLLTPFYDVTNNICFQKASFSISSHLKVVYSDLHTQV